MKKKRNRKNKYSDEELLEFFKQKAEQLGRTPTREDINEDKAMPDSGTYINRFGGLYATCRLAGLPSTKIINITVEKVIWYIKDYYEKYKKVPKSSEFDKTEGYPHTSHIRRMFGMTWNQFLLLADLPIYANDKNSARKRSAELLVKNMLLSEGYTVEDLSADTQQAKNSFIVNGNIKINVRSSALVNENGKLTWKFKHLQKDADYFICVGFNEDDYEILLVVPAKDIDVTTITVTHKLEVSKYNKYLTDQIKL